MPNMPNLVINLKVKMLAAALFHAQTQGSWKKLYFYKGKIPQLSGLVNPKVPFIQPPSENENRFLKKFVNCEFLKKEALKGFQRQIQQ